MRGTVCVKGGHHLEQGGVSEVLHGLGGAHECTKVHKKHCAGWVGQEGMHKRCSAD